MTRIYLIRHAEAEGNLYRIAQGQYNSLLTDRGWRQVEALRRRFEGEQIDAVYASDLYRTCATASALSEPRGLRVQRLPGLREICVGEWEQCTWGEIHRRDPEMMRCFQSDMIRWHVEGAETPQEVLNRVRNTVEAIARENDGKTVAVFCHGYAIRLLLAGVQGLSLEETGRTPHGDNTAVSLLEYENGALRVVFRDDNSHLQTPEYTAKEKVRRRATALEPGLWFAPLDLSRQEEFFCAGAAAAMKDAGDSRIFDRAVLLSGAAGRTTLVGHLGERAVGLVQFGPEPEWISLLYIQPDFRCQGYGVQLLGQAVQYARRLDAQTLRVALPRQTADMAFFADYGFRAAAQLEDGRVVLEKSIAFDPRFLAEA